MHLFCKIVGHRRCKRQAYFSGRAWMSVCRRCGAKMQRVSRGHWVQRRAARP